LCTTPASPQFLFTIYSRNAQQLSSLGALNLAKGPPASLRQQRSSVRPTTPLVVIKVRPPPIHDSPRVERWTQKRDPITNKVNTIRFGLTYADAQPFTKEGIADGGNVPIDNASYLGSSETPLSILVSEFPARFRRVVLKFLVPKGSARRQRPGMITAWKSDPTRAIPLLRLHGLNLSS